MRSASYLALLALAGLPRCATPSPGDGDADLDADAGDAGDAGGDADAAPTPCDDSSDCDDRIECTEDMCSVGGVCRNEPVDARCGDGERCLPAVGCTDSECVEHRDCADGVFCNGDERCIVGRCYDSERDCEDGDSCTRDWCDFATDRCAHEALAECAGDGGTDAGHEPFDPERHYDGAFRVVGVPRSDCFAATYSITRLTFASSPAELTVQAGSFRMTEVPRPDGPDFRTSYTQSGCGTYVLSGSFLNADELTARWTATFSGGCEMCDNQDATGVYAVRE